MNSALQAVATIPVPTGWRYLLEDGMPSIERDVLGMTLTVGLDDGKWRWWLCHAHASQSMNRGEAADLVDAIGQAFDALALHFSS